MTPEDASMRAKDLFLSLNCSSLLSNADLLSCAQISDPDLIIDRVLQYMPTLSYLKNIGGIEGIFNQPVLDNIVFNQSIDSILRSGRIKKAKIITGFNSDEFNLFLSSYWPLNAQNKYGYTGFHFKEFTNVINRALYYYPSYPNKINSSFLNELIDHYFKSYELAANLVYPVYLNYFIQIMSDFLFACSNFELAESFSNNQLDAYVYELKHRRYDSQLPIYLGTTPHADDILYSFGIPLSNKVKIFFICVFGTFA